jgi:UDP-glucose:(heptosyl)LPS alpha-1,3-glucosyltransferase
MRVGIDVRVADPQDSGQQRYLWRLGAWLGRRGHPVDFLALRRQPDDVVTPAGATLHRLHGRSRPQLLAYVSDLALDVLLINPERSRRYRGLPANLLRSGYGTEHYVQKLRSFRSPVERALRQALRYNPLDAAERRWERDFYEGTEPQPCVIAQSAYMRSEIMESYRVPADLIHVVPNGVDTEEFNPRVRRTLRSEMRARWGIPDDAVCLLVLAHNFRLKGLWDIFAALARRDGCEGIHLLVAGRGTGRAQRAEARRRVRRLGIESRVTLAGPVRPAIHAHAAADALVHLSWHDSFGFVILEAMACGLPVVTTPYVGASELMEDGVSGIIVDPGDRSAIGDAMIRLLDPNLRSTMGSQAALAGAAHDEVTNFARVEGVMNITAERTGRPITA